MRIGRRWNLSESMLNTPEGSTKIAPLLMASRAAMKLRASERAIPRLQRAIAMLEEQEQETNNVLWDLITRRVFSRSGRWCVRPERSWG
jgi:hypothetical protein